MNDDNIPPGADAYWESAVDTTDYRDDPPEDHDHDITDERAEQWAREIGEEGRPLEDILADLAEVYGVPV
jgi:hypothetical protein